LLPLTSHAQHDLPHDGKQHRAVKGAPHRQDRSQLRLILGAYSSSPVKKRIFFPDGSFVSALTVAVDVSL
jgi:hypothetical protein